LYFVPVPLDLVFMVAYRDFGEQVTSFSVRRFSQERNDLKTVTAK